MGLCSQRTCGCALQSTDFALTGSGTSVDPWVIGFPVSNSQLPMRVFTDAATRDAALPSPAEGQEVWLSTPDTKHRFLGGVWRTIFQKPTAYSPTFGNFTVGSSTVTASYRRFEDEVVYNGRVVLGAGAAVGVGLIQASLPVPLLPSMSGVRVEGLGGMFDSSASVIYSASLDLSTGVVAFLVTTGATNLSQSPTVPFTWTSGDEFWWTAQYPAA